MGNSNFFSARVAGTLFPYEQSSHFLRCWSLWSPLEQRLVVICSGGFSMRRSFMVRANTTERIRQKVPTEK
jgi:hypothetical protein